MLTLIALAFLASPPLPPRCLWWSRTERRCRDADMEILGSWDPRPAPYDWPNSYYTPPPEFGVFPTEQRRHDDEHP